MSIVFLFPFFFIIPFFLITLQKFSSLLFPTPGFIGFQDFVHRLTSLIWTVTIILINKHRDKEILRCQHEVRRERDPSQGSDA